jgi:hypothetical protein
MLWANPFSQENGILVRPGSGTDEIPGKIGTRRGQQRIVSSGSAWLQQQDTAKAERTVP